VPPYLPRHIASWAFLRMASTSEGSAFASGLISLLQPVVIECDQRLQGVFDSQRLLAAQIDALASQLDRFNSVSGTPPLYPHIDKLLRAKARMVVINTTLASIQHRISRLQNEQAPRPSSTTTPLYVASSAGPLSNSTASTSAAGVSWSPLSSSSSSSSSSGRGAASGGLSSWLSKARSALSEAHEPLSKLPSLAGLAGPVPSYQQAAHPAEDPPTSSPSSSSPTGAERMLSSLAFSPKQLPHPFPFFPLRLQSHRPLRLQLSQSLSLRTSRPPTPLKIQPLLLRSQVLNGCSPLLPSHQSNFLTLFFSSLSVFRATDHYGCSCLRAAGGSQGRRRGTSSS